MTGYEFTPSPEKLPQTRPAFSGGPPCPPPPPPKLTARDLLEPGEPGKRLFLSEYTEVAELAGLLGVRPFKLVAELLGLRIFKYADDLLDFSTAATLAIRHGFIAERILP